MPAAEHSQSQVAQALLEEQLRMCSVHSQAGLKARTVVVRLASEGALLSDSASEERVRNFRCGLMAALAEGLVERIGRLSWSTKFQESLDCACRMTGMDRRDGVELFLAELNTRLQLRARHTQTNFAQGCLRQEPNPAHFVQTILDLARDHSLLNVAYITAFRDALLLNEDEAVLPDNATSRRELQAVLDEALMRTHISQVDAAATTVAPRARRASL
jgi:hypothetical protein